MLFLHHSCIVKQLFFAEACLSGMWPAHSFGPWRPKSKFGFGTNQILHPLLLKLKASVCCLFLLLHNLLTFLAHLAPGISAVDWRLASTLHCMSPAHAIGPCTANTLPLLANGLTLPAHLLPLTHHPAASASHGWSLWLLSRLEFLRCITDHGVQLLRCIAGHGVPKLDLSCPH